MAISSAFTLTRDTHDKLGVEVKVIGCESNAPSHTHSAHIFGGGQTHKHVDIVRVCTQSHTQYTQATGPAPRQKARGCFANRVMTWM